MTPTQLQTVVMSSYDVSVGDADIKPWSRPNTGDLFVVERLSPANSVWTSYTLSFKDSISMPPGTLLVFLVDVDNILYMYLKGAIVTWSERNARNNLRMVVTIDECHSG